MASGHLQSRASCASLSGTAGLCGRVLKSCPFHCPCPGPRVSCWTWRPLEAVSLISSLALDFLLRNHRWSACDDYSVSLFLIWQFTHLPNLLFQDLHQVRNLGDHAAN